MFGHSKIEINKELENILFNTFENLIIQGCEDFYFGGFGEFDELCHKVISNLKNTYPNLQRIFCLSNPKHQQISKRPKWLKNEDYEKFTYLNLEFDWWYKRFFYRNCAMIDHSDFVVFYVEPRENSGAYKAYQYAKRNKKQIINVKL